MKEKFTAETAEIAETEMKIRVVINLILCGLCVLGGKIQLVLIQEVRG